MKGKGLGMGLAIAGLVIVVVALVLMLAVVPGMKKLPADTNVTRTYDGTMTVLFDPKTGQFTRNLPIVLTRHFYVTQTSGDAALVREDKTITSNGQPLETLTNDYAIGRSTMLATSTYPSSWTGSPGFWNRQGVVLSWPIGTKQQDYTGWSDDYRAAVPLKFAGAVADPRSGTKTYLFTSQSGPKPIDPAQVTFMGLPTSIAKQQLQGMVAAAKMDPTIVKMLPQILTKVPGTSVPLQYTYAYEGKYWVDPATGILIDTQKHEVRKAGLPDTLLKGIPLLAILPPSELDAMRVPVSDYTYQASDQSVKDARSEAQDKGGKLTLYGTTIPWIAIVVGAVLLIAGVVLALRTPKSQTA